MRQFLCLFVLLLAAQSVFPADCTGYVDSFDVYVVDTNLRPVEGAAVQVKFDRGTSFGEQYHVTPARYTDATGLLHYTVSNQGTMTRKLDCKIYINASSGGAAKTVTVTANQHSSTILVELPIYEVAVKVQNQYKNPLENATVTVVNVTKTTGSDGMAYYFLPEGSYGFLANYLSGKQSGTIPVVKDTRYDIVIAYNPIDITVSDDYGEPLACTLRIFETEYELPEGNFTEQKAFGERIEYSVAYQDLEKTGEIYPDDEGSVRMVFDRHAPVFGAINTTGDANITRLVIPVRDEGRFASGLKYESILVRYRMEPADAGTPWSDAVTFASSIDTFMADFIGLPQNSIVQFRVEVTDNEGNKATVDGRFSPIPQEKPPENGDIPQDNGEQPQENTLLYIIVVVFIVFLVVFLVYRIKSGQGKV